MLPTRKLHFLRSCTFSYSSDPYPPPPLGCPAPSARPAPPFPMYYIPTLVTRILPHPLAAPPRLLALRHPFLSVLYTYPSDPYPPPPPGCPAQSARPAPPFPLCCVYMYLPQWPVSAPTPWLPRPVRTPSAALSSLYYIPTLVTHTRPHPLAAPPRLPALPRPFLSVLYTYPSDPYPPPSLADPPCAALSSLYYIPTLETRILPHPLAAPPRLHALSRPFHHLLPLCCR